MQSSGQQLSGYVYWDSHLDMSCMTINCHSYQPTVMFNEYRLMTRLKDIYYTQLLTFITPNFSDCLKIT